MASIQPRESYVARLENDPLNEQQKRAIHAYVNQHLCPLRDLDVDFDHRWMLISTISKTYDSYNPDYLKRVKGTINNLHKSSTCFDLFRRVLNNPTERALQFGIDPKRHDQLFAAQMFMRAAIRNTEEDFSGVCHKYDNKMVSRGCDRGKISIKNQLLMQNDPVERLDGKPNPTPLQVLLANTYQYIPNELQQEEKAKFLSGIKPILRTAFEVLYTKRAAKEIMDALAVLFSNEKGNIFFNTSHLSTGELGKPYKTDSATTLEKGYLVRGFYNKNHTFFMSSFINPYENSIVLENLGYFVHEALHFIFSRMFKNDSSPAAPGSIEEALLDNLLAADRKHRQQLKRTDDPQELRVWKECVDELEGGVGYFEKGYNHANHSHRYIMRAEAIVRVMQLIVEGIPVEKIRKIAPNLCDFYFRLSKPCIEQYVKDNARNLNIPSKQVPASQESPKTKLPLKQRIAEVFAKASEYLKGMFKRLGFVIKAFFKAENWFANLDYPKLPKMSLAHYIFAP